MNGLVRSGLAVVAASALVGLTVVSPAAASVESLALTPNTGAPGATVSVSGVFGASDWTTGNILVTLRVDPLLGSFAVPNPEPSWATPGSCETTLGGNSVFCLWTPANSGQQVQLTSDFTIDPLATGTIEVTARSTITPANINDESTQLLAVVVAPTQTANPTPTPTVPATPTLAPTDGAGSGTGGEAGTAGTTAEVPTAVPAGEGPLDSSGNGALPWAWVALLTGFGAAGVAASFKVRTQRLAASH